MSFFNTTGETGETLKKYRKDAATQDGRILKFLTDRPFHWFHAESLQLLIFGAGTPITSVRRSLSNLYKSGQIEKSDTANAVGPYGHHVYTWRFKP